MKNFKWIRQPMLLSAMKRIFVRSPMYKAVKDAAKVPYVAKNKDGSDSKAKRYQYRCAHCQGLFFDRREILIRTNSKGQKQKKKIKLIQVDHVSPVIHIDTGFTNMDNWIDREFVGIEVWDTNKNTIVDLKDKLQLLCYECHEAKSAKENERRREVKKKKRTVS